MNVHHSIGNDAKKNLHQRWIEMDSGNLQNKNINRYTQKIAIVSFTIFRDRKQKKSNKIIMFCILFCLFVVLNWFIFRILVRCSCYDVPHHVFKFHSECNPNKQQQQEPANRQLAANHFMNSIRPIQSRLFVRWLCTLYTDWALSIVVSQIFWAKQKKPIWCIHLNVCRPTTVITSCFCFFIFVIFFVFLSRNNNIFHFDANFILCSFFIRLSMSLYTLALFWRCRRLFSST